MEDKIKLTGKERDSYLQYKISKKKIERDNLSRFYLMLGIANFIVWSPIILILCTVKLLLWLFEAGVKALAYIEKTAGRFIEWLPKIGGSHYKELETELYEVDNEILNYEEIIRDGYDLMVDKENYQAWKNQENLNNRKHHDG